VNHRPWNSVSASPLTKGFLFCGQRWDTDLQHPNGANPNSLVCYPLPWDPSTLCVRLKRTYANCLNCMPPLAGEQVRFFARICRKNDTLGRFQAAVKIARLAQFAHRSAGLALGISDARCESNWEHQQTSPGVEDVLLLLAKA
jgi:hypothetical protein